MSFTAIFIFIKINITVEAPSMYNFNIIINIIIKQYIKTIY